MKSCFIVISLHHLQPADAAAFKALCTHLHPELQIVGLYKRYFSAETADKSMAVSRSLDRLC